MTLRTEYFQSYRVMFFLIPHQIIKLLLDGNTSADTEFYNKY